MEKEKKDDLREEVDELKKSNKIMKGLLIVLVVAILVSACFGIGFIAGEKLAEKENDILEEDKKEETKEETKTDEPEKEEEKVDNTISDALRKDLDKKVDLTYHFVVTGLYVNKPGSVDVKNIFAENVDAYPYFANATYDYYIYKTGAKKEKYSTKDASLPTCYEDSQNGYCYVVSKEMIVKYNKEMYNVSMDAFNLGDWTATRGDKVYVTGVPWNGGYNTEKTGVISVTKNNDTIEYVASHTIELNGDDKKSTNIKYIFKTNEDGNFYLHSFEKM